VTRPGPGSVATTPFLRTYPARSLLTRIIQLTLALTPGTRLGVYEVTELIGVGFDKVVPSAFPE
jgi:hypothetical protein